MSKTIEQLYNEHKGLVTDKWSLYLDEYQRLFATYKDGQIRLLEIGIQNGGSLEIWGKYFSNAELIIGCDINPKCKLLQYGDPRIKVFVGDANSEDYKTKILQDAESFDIIIDDGSHRSGDIIRSFSHYFPLVNDNGIYVVEDLHCSYWQEFEGGLHNPFSAMAFFKRLADILNYEHWRNSKPRTAFLEEFMVEFGLEFNEDDFTKIHSIEFINSVCTIKKSPPEKNILGRRVVVGEDESVLPGVKRLNGTGIVDLSSNIEDDATLDIFELISRANSSAVYEQQIQTLQQEVVKSNYLLAQREQLIKDESTKLNDIYSSKAWKLTQKIWGVRQVLAPHGSRRERALLRFLK